MDNHKRPLASIMWSDDFGCNEYYSYLMLLRMKFVLHTIYYGRSLISGPGLELSDTVCGLLNLLLLRET